MELYKITKEKIEVFYFILLFILTTISVYYFPPVINKIFFLILLLITWVSKKDYFWLVFFIIIASSPFRLFEDYGGQTLHRIPNYDIIGSYSIGFNDFFLILFFFKAMIKGTKNKLVLQKQYLIILGLIILLYILSFVYGFSGKTLITNTRWLLYFSLFYSVPRLIKNDSVIFIFRIFIIFTLLTIINQILTATIGFNIADTIAGTELTDKQFVGVRYVRAYDSVLVQFFTFIFGLVMYRMRKPIIKKNHLLLIIVISYLSIFMTGTRGWILAFSCVVTYFFLFIETQKSKFFVLFIITIMLVVSIASFIPQLQFLLRSNIDRIQTLESLAKGDVTAGGSLQRLSIRLPRLIEGIKQNPILGWGFSDTYDYYADTHVGWASQILQMGIVGLIIFMNFWINFWKYNKRLAQKLSLKNPFKQTVITLNIGLLCLLIIHSTSRSMFNFGMNRAMLVLVIMYFILSDMWVKIALEAENGYIQRKLLSEKI